MHKLHMKFLSLNIDFDGPSLDFLGSRNLRSCARGHQNWHHKSRYFTVVGKSFVKTVADRHVHAAYQTSTSDELFSRINIDDFERSYTFEIRAFY